ncbi:MAG: hypothetical protein HYU66_09090, partial [Armatimonadetes bacterium]|nr:hypothetical protein [Armatimonadota bacterium]
MLRPRLWSAAPLATALAALTACHAQNPPQPPPLPPGVVREAGVVYGKAGDRELHLNIERPDPLPAGPTPVVVYIHGGAWRGGTHNNGSNV